MSEKIEHFLVTPHTKYIFVYHQQKSRKFILEWPRQLNVSKKNVAL